MARARSAADRKLVARGRGRARGARLRITLDPALVRRATRLALPLAATALGLRVGVPWVCGVARSHPYFAVHEVVVRHRGALDADTIRGFAGVEVGANVWDVDADAVARRLLGNGWIRSASVRRELPDRVVLQVREQRPVAILAVADESPGLYFLATNARIFAPVPATNARDLPIVTGLARADLAGTDAFGPRALRSALVLLRRAARRPELGTISEVHVDRAEGLVLLPERPALAIEIGWSDYDTKLARVAEVLPRWKGREGELRTVSCLFDDDVIVRLRDPSPAVPGKPGAKTTKSKTRTAKTAVGA